VTAWKEPPAKVEAVVSGGFYVVYQVRREREREGGRDVLYHRTSRLGSLWVTLPPSFPPSLPSSPGCGRSSYWLFWSPSD